MKILSVWGVLAPISYVATVTLGGSLSQSYSDITQTGSEMIETGAPNKSLLDALFPVHDRLLAFFSSRLRARTKTLQHKDQE